MPLPQAVRQEWPRAYCQLAVARGWPQEFRRECRCWRAREPALAAARRSHAHDYVENLFSVPLDKIYVGFEDRIVSNRTFHAKINGGVTGRF